MRNAYTDPKVCILVELRQTKGGTSSGGSRKKYLGGAWPLIIWEAITAKRNYYRTN